MDYFSEALAIIKLATDAYASAQRLVAAGKAAGDPTPDEIKVQMDEAKAANQRLHDLINAP